MSLRNVQKQAMIPQGKVNKHKIFKNRNVCKHCKKNNKYLYVKIHNQYKCSKCGHLHKMEEI